LLNKLHVVPVL